MSTTDLTIFSDDGYSTTLKIAETLVKSGVLPRGIDNPFKAFAIIQKGREIGVGPMRALTGIALIEGKPTVSPELKLEQFRQRGGHVKWIKSDNLVAQLYLKAPNGDEHEETVTMEDMKTAGVAGKDNWRRYPKSMLRARCVGFGLRALGEGDGSYTPDELGAVTNESGEVEYVPPPQAKEGSAPKAASARPAGTTNATTTAPQAASASTTTNGSAPVTSKPARANLVKHDGKLANHKQITLLHILRSKVGGLVVCDKKPCYFDDDGTPTKAVKILCAYHVQLAAFKDQKGRPITTSKDLSEAQISNLIDRYEAKIKQQEARASEQPDLAAVVETTHTEVDSIDAIREAIAAKESDGDESCEMDVLSLYGVNKLSELPPEHHPGALALVLAWKTGAYITIRQKLASQL